MDIYAETILDHYRHPRGQGTVASPTVEHTEKNISCGDELALQLTIKDGTIIQSGWSGTGCAISQASMSLLSEDLTGKTTEEIDAMTQKDIYALLGVPVGPRRFKCALLSLHLLKNALQKAKGDEPQGWLETVE